MAIEDTRKLKVCSSLQQANAFIEAGWTLINANEFVIDDSLVSRFTLAWQKEGEPVEVPWQSGW